MIKTKDQFLARLEEVYKQNVEISRKKNGDYADENSPFKNFLVSESFGIPAAQAILVRMSDKMTRAANLLNREAQVADESVFDTLSDLANYAMILRMHLENEKQKGHR